MAGAELKKKSRGQYTAAGYMQGELYIEQVQAGSARDLMRDNNRIGYSAQELDDDGLPFAFLTEEREIQRPKERRAQREITSGERIARAMRREKHAVALCCALLMLNLTLLAFWGQAMIDGVRTRDQIAMYEEGIKAYQMEISDARMKIAAATGGERIRNIAQNELGMLRGERVNTKTIYIQTLGLSSDETQEVAARQETGLLDWLLSVADIFDFLI